MTSSSPKLSLVLAFPAGENDRLERWTRTVPHATWPDWGGHVTIWPAFEPATGTEALFAALEAVAARFEAFELSMSEAVLKPFWGSPNLYTAQLVAGPDEPGAGELEALRSGLYQMLADVAIDLHPETRSSWFQPHVSLTIGIDHDAAAEVVAAARRDAVHVRFFVDRVDLYESPGEGGYRRAGSFALSHPGQQRLGA